MSKKQAAKTITSLFFNHCILGGDIKEFYYFLSMDFLGFKPIKYNMSSRRPPFFYFGGVDFCFINPLHLSVMYIQYVYGLS